MSSKQNPQEHLFSGLWNVKCVFTVCIWALHFLSTSEDVQDKLYQELDEVLGSDPVTLDKIPQLK